MQVWPQRLGDISGMRQGMIHHLAVPAKMSHSSKQTVISNRSRVVQLSDRPVGPLPQSSGFRLIASCSSDM